MGNQKVKKHKKKPKQASNKKLLSTMSGSVTLSPVFKGLIKKFFNSKIFTKNELIKK